MQCGVDDPGFHLIYVYNLYVYIHIVYIYICRVFIFVYIHVYESHPKSKLNTRANRCEQRKNSRQMASYGIANGDG